MFKTNEYFDGKVKSIAFTTAQGPATVGVMAPGEYEFGASTVEVMTVTSGTLSIMLPDSSEWVEYGPNGAFTVQADKKFKVRTQQESSYLCLYQ